MVSWAPSRAATSTSTLPLLWVLATPDLAQTRDLCILGDCVSLCAARNAEGEKQVKTLKRFKRMPFLAGQYGTMCTFLAQMPLTTADKQLWHNGRGSFGGVFLTMCARILGECTTIHSLPALFFSFRWRLGHTLIPLFGPGSVHSGSES